MPKPAAKEDDKILATDIHLVNGSPMPLPFTGTIDGNLSATVIVQHKSAAFVGSSATNLPAHLPPPGKTFDKPPTNKGLSSEAVVPS